MQKGMLYVELIALVGMSIGIDLQWQEAILRVSWKTKCISLFRWVLRLVRSTYGKRGLVRPTLRRQSLIPIECEFPIICRTAVWPPNSTGSLSQIDRIEVSYCWPKNCRSYRSRYVELDHVLVMMWFWLRRNGQWSKPHAWSVAECLAGPYVCINCEEKLPHKMEFRQTANWMKTRIKTNGRCISPPSGNGSRVETLTYEKGKTGWSRRPSKWMDKYSKNWILACAVTIGARSAFRYYRTFQWLHPSLRRGQALTAKQSWIQLNSDNGGLQ